MQVEASCTMDLKQVALKLPRELSLVIQCYPYLLIYCIIYSFLTYLWCFISHHGFFFASCFFLSFFSPSFKTCYF